MSMQATNFERIHCVCCDLTFGDEQPDEKGNVYCPQCGTFICNVISDIVRVNEETCRCSKCGGQFGIASEDLTPVSCPICKMN